MTRLKDSIISSSEPQLTTSLKSKAVAAQEYMHQADRLSGSSSEQEGTTISPTAAVKANFLTPQDPVIETANGGRLPGVPLQEAHRLNQLREELLNHVTDSSHPTDESRDGGAPVALPIEDPNASSETESPRPSTSLRSAAPPSTTNPLFPSLPLYGPPSLLRNIQSFSFRCSSAVLSLAFLGVIVLGSAFTSIPLMVRHIGIRLTGGNPEKRRPFHELEEKRKAARKDAARDWEHKKRRRNSHSKLQSEDNADDVEASEAFEPTEGGPDPLICDVAYYARRVGLDIEEFRVQTEDGFIITLWHVYNPEEYTPAPELRRDHRGPTAFPLERRVSERFRLGKHAKKRYPVLLIHGLLQSSGAYCTNDDDSLAFFLCKSGYDVWLGNNRCGFKPEHTMLKYSDPRMWAWNIRQMGVIDLSALVSRVLGETGFEKLGLICHSQGTTETFVALAKGQRPDLGDKISVFCALAPAAYAGPLIGKMYFKFMRIISPMMFRVFFGIHAFIPFMMTMHQVLPGRLYGAMGYRVFSFLFNWTDDRWEQDLRDRMFQFAPVYVSAESMRWWLGRECFAKHRCILSTKEEARKEDVEDEEESSDDLSNAVFEDQDRNCDERHGRETGATAWYDEHVPPFALWIAGSDDLVDGNRLLRRFERGREPFVKVVHAKVIPEYEHLDVIWAMDSIEKVGNEVRSVIWQTAPDTARRICRTPKGCEGHNDKT